MQPTPPSCNAGLDLLAGLELAGLDHVHVDVGLLRLGVVEVDVVALAPVGARVGDDAVGDRDERSAGRREHVVARVHVAVAGGAERVLRRAVVDLADDRHERAGVAALLPGGLPLPLLARKVGLADRHGCGRARRNDAQGIGGFGALAPAAIAGVATAMAVTPVTSKRVFERGYDMRGVTSL